MSQPANLLVSCLDSAPYDGYNDYDDEGDDVKTGKWCYSVKTSDDNSDEEIEEKIMAKVMAKTDEIKKKKQDPKLAKIRSSILNQQKM